MVNKKTVLTVAILLLTISIVFTGCDRKSEPTKDNTTNKNETPQKEILGSGSTGGAENTEDNTGSTGLAFTPHSGGTCYISGIGSCTDTNIIIPKYIDGYKVTGISERAFYNCKSFTKIIIPDSITFIGVYAFGKCVNLETVNLPDSITSIGARAFSNCESLTSIILPNSVVNFEYATFWGCFNLASITIPISVSYIGDSVLMGCHLENIYFKGTQSQWDAIRKVNTWDYGAGTYTIHCIDATIPKS